jgi:cell division protein FtsB
MLIQQATTSTVPFISSQFVEGAIMAFFAGIITVLAWFLKKSADRWDAIPNQLAEAIDGVTKTIEGLTVTITAMREHVESELLKIDYFKSWILAVHERHHPDEKFPEPKSKT